MKKIKTKASLNNYRKTLPNSVRLLASLKLDLSN